MPKGIPNPKEPTMEQIVGVESQATEEGATAELAIENERLKAQIKKMRSPKGIPTAPHKEEVIRNPDGSIKREEQVLKEAYQDAMIKTPSTFTQKEIVSIEREIRRYVKRGGYKKNFKGDPIAIPGGWIKGTTEAQKAECQRLLKLLGRTELAWDMSIVVPGFSGIA